jgi:diacylglycerol kinase (ATP)
VKIALIHNPDAFLGEVDGYELRNVFEREGHDVVYVNTNAQDWQRAISDGIARAIIVGGDGTVQAVAPHLGITPFNILPYGTANNIADCLRQTPDPELLATNLDRAEINRLDLGKLTFGSESKTFLEAVGAGVFAELILELGNPAKINEMKGAESRNQKFEFALESLEAISRRYSAIEWELKADDTIIRDRFILVAVMNMELIGPRLHLAPEADPSDGYLDLVCVREMHRDVFSRWLEGQSPGLKDAANFERRRCRRVEARASSMAPVHVDSAVITRPAFPLVMELQPAALKYALTPGTRGGLESKGRLLKESGLHNQHLPSQTLIV